MKIRPSNLARSLVNRQAYPQPYINRPFQTLSTTLGSHLFGRTAQKKDLPLLPELLGWHSSSSRPRTGIVFPLQPCQRRPDTYIDVEAAALPEPAALQRDDPLPSCEVSTDLTRPVQRPACKRHRKRSSALYRPAKLSPPRGRWCII